MVLLYVVCSTTERRTHRIRMHVQLTCKTQKMLTLFSPFLFLLFFVCLC